MHISKINILISLIFNAFYMFQTEGPFSGSRLHVPLWYGTFCMHRYKQSSR